MTRDEFQVKAKEQVDVLFKKINELEAKSEELADGARAEISEQVSHLKKKKDEMEKKLHGYADVAEERWEDFSGEFSEMVSGIKDAVSGFWNKRPK